MVFNKTTFLYLGKTRELGANKMRPYWDFIQITFINSTAELRGGVCGAAGGVNQRWGALRVEASRDDGGSPSLFSTEMNSYWTAFDL